MTQAEDVVPPDQAVQNLALERYKATLDFWKFVLVSGFAAIVIALLPPLFQYETARLEDARKERELSQSKATFHDTYVKDFFQEALKQDIEVRIRLAMYFASVSDGDYKKDWNNYLTALTDLRQKIRDEINAGEAKLGDLQEVNSADLSKRRQVARELAWKYGELGYAAPDRDVGAVRSFSFSPQLSNVASVQAQLQALRTDEQFLNLAKAMEPRLANRSPELQRLVKTIDPDGARLSGNVPKAKQVINAWMAEEDMTPANRQQWLDAIASISGAAKPVTDVTKFPKATNNRADLEKIRKSRLASGAKSSELTEDDMNWVLTTVWPGGD
jgi:hypothetical protein